MQFNPSRAVQLGLIPTESILAGSVYTGEIVLWAIEAAAPSSGK